MSVAEQFLREMHWAVTEQTRAALEHSPLLTELRLEADRQAEADRAYLASLTPSELRAELLRRRIADVERRYRDWWETHMAWRLRKDPPPEPDYYGW